MIASMTGYGQSHLEREKVKLGVEIRSVNSRFLDIQVRLPRFLQLLEHQVKELVQETIHRGKISLFLTWEEGLEDTVGISLDHNAARSFHRLLNELKDLLELKGNVEVGHLLSFSEIFKQERKEWEVEEAWILVQEAVASALSSLQQTRLEEGEQLSKDITQRIHRLEDIVSDIQQGYPQRVEQIQRRLREKIDLLVESSQVDEQRLAMEVALLAERSDITEECVRFRSHNKLFLSALESRQPVGRKLTFLLQEMNREANTMGSKASDVTVAHRVVEIKEEIERLREQVQNVE